MKIFQEEVLQQFNHFYKELDDLYHEIALKIGISNSALAILYTSAYWETDVFRKMCVRKHISVSRRLILQ